MMRQQASSPDGRSEIRDVIPGPDTIVNERRKCASRRFIQALHFMLLFSAKFAYGMTPERLRGMFFRHPSARLPSLNDWPSVFPELVENRQFLGKAQRRALPATSRLLSKDICDVRVLLRFAHGRNLFQKIAFSSLGAIGLPSGHKVETLQNSLEGGQIYRFLVYESVNSGQVFQTTNF